VRLNQEPRCLLYVGQGTPTDERTQVERPPSCIKQALSHSGAVWFEQLWFPGNHADIGGSYPENFPRLSDIALKRMLDVASAVGLKINPDLMQLYPIRPGLDTMRQRATYLNALLSFSAKLAPDALCMILYYRGPQAPVVRHYDEMRPYRPENLREHEGLKQYYR
jgi:type VI secretion system (T6SS) phospholipase Tle1-like effector